MAVINPAHVSWSQWFHVRATALQHSANRVANFVRENPFYAISCAASMAKLANLCLTRGFGVALKEVASTSLLPLNIAMMGRFSVGQENTVLKKVLSILTIINTFSTFSQPFSPWNITSHPVVFLVYGLNGFDRRAPFLR